LRLARYILTLIVAAQIAGAHAQGVTVAAPPPVEPFAEDQAEIPDCIDPLDALALDVHAKAELVRESNGVDMVQSGRCRLLRSYEAAQQKLIKFVSENWERCGIRREYRSKINATHRGTQRLMMKACTMRLASPSPAENYFP
jgi:hypothetical protein